MEEEIIQLIQNEKLSKKDLRKELEHYHENDIALVLPSLNKEQRIKLYSVLGKERTSEVFTYLDEPQEFLKELEEEDVIDILEEMTADDAVDVLEELDDENKEKLINKLEDDIADDINLISSYDEDEVGSRMDTSFITIKKNYSITKAMKTLVKEAGEHENINYLYVINDDETFFGVIELRDLIRARKDDDLEKIIHTSYPIIKDHERVEDVINSLKEYDMSMYPVLNDKNEIIGVITSSDIIEATDDELSEDYIKLVGISEEEDLDEPLKTSLKKRSPWLIILLGLCLVISLLISSFEAVIAIIPMVVFFQSIILDMAGNVGTQSLAVTVRFLSDEKVDKKKLLKLTLKELRVGFFNGLILGIFSFILVFSFLCIKHTGIVEGTEFSYYEASYVALSVFGSLVIALTLSSLFGVLIPALFKKFKIDPAVASGPFMTTLDDMIAVVTYYGLVMLFFLPYFIK